MRNFAPASAFIDAMKDIATWGEVTLIVHTDDGIMEFTGPVPRGRGRARLLQPHGRAPASTAICATSAARASPSWSGRSWAGLSASILFFNVDGGIMFKVFVGRDEKRELADQLANFARWRSGWLVRPPRPI